MSERAPTLAELRRPRAPRPAAWLLAGSLAVTLAACAPATTPPPPPSPPGVTCATAGQPAAGVGSGPVGAAGSVGVVNAGTLLDSIGVNVHMSYPGTSYARAPVIIQRLRQLGVRVVRDNLPAQPTPQLAAVYRAFAAAGIAVDAVIGSAARVDELAPAQPVLDWIRTEGLACAPIVALEGPNEWDTRGGGGWVQEDLSFQTELFQGARALDPRITVVAPSTARSSRRFLLNGLSTIADVSSNHSYPAGALPTDGLDQQLADARAALPDKPVWATETGYRTAQGLGGNLGQPPVSEQAQAMYLPRLVLDYFRAGVARTFIYELADEHQDGAGAAPERHFGLLRSTLQPKPAFLAVGNVVAALGPAAAAGSATATPPAVQLIGPDGLQHLLVDRGGGQYALCLWRNVLVPGSAGLLPGQTTPPAQVDVDLGPGVDPSSVRQLTGWAAQQPTAVPLGAARVQVGVADQLVVLAFHATSATAD